MDKIIFVSDEKDLEGLKKYQKIQFICRRCHKLTERLFLKNRIETIKKFLCKKCNTELTNIERFGCKNPAQAQSIKEKTFSTNLKKYGNKCSLNGKEQIEKKKNTWIKHFGKDNPWQKDDIKEKVKSNNIEKYGKEYAFNARCFQIKSLKTKKKKGILRIVKIQYELDDLIFDSSWEVVFYIWHRDNNIPIERNPIKLNYLYHGVVHTTTVDFKVNDQLIEIKCKYFMALDDVQKARVRALIDNNVIILTDVSRYMRYVNDKYGKNYIKTLIRKR